MDENILGDMVSRGTDIRTMIESPIWSGIKSILDKRRENALKDLIDAENIEARATIHVIDGIYNDINNSLKMADVAREKLNRK